MMLGVWWRVCDMLGVSVSVVGAVGEHAVPHVALINQGMRKKRVITSHVNHVLGGREEFQTRLFLTPCHMALPHRCLIPRASLQRCMTRGWLRTRQRMGWGVGHRWVEGGGIPDGSAKSYTNKISRATADGRSDKYTLFLKGIRD